MPTWLGELLGFLSGGGRFRLEFYVVPPNPQPASIRDVVFFFNSRTRQMTGKVILNTPDPSLNLTSRPVGIVINGGPETVLDYIDPNVTFPCNEGDQVVATPKGDVNAAGQGAAGSPFTATATTGGGNLPPAPVVQSIEFTA